MAVVSEGIAQVLIPPELSSPDRKKRLQEILCLHKHVGIIEVSFKVDNTLMGTNTNGQEEIVVNIFDSGEMICICDHCRCSDIPHFNWYPKRGKPVRLMMEKAMPLDTDVNMELRERKRLQQHLSFANWHKLTNAWNEHNARQLSPLFHVPNYINLQTHGNNPEAKIQKDGEITGKIFIDSEDTDERPHFHYCRPDGTEVMISLTAAQYLEPVVFELNRKEKAALAQFMTELWPNDFNGFTVYARLCFDWDNYHPTDWFLPNQYADIFPMPDYTRLKKYKWAINNPNEYP